MLTVYKNVCMGKHSCTMTDIFRIIHKTKFSRLSFPSDCRNVEINFLNQKLFSFYRTKLKKHFVSKLLLQSTNFEFSPFLLPPPHAPRQQKFKLNFAQPPSH